MPVFAFAFGETDGDPYPRVVAGMFALGIPTFMLALGTLIAANLNALRSHRHRADELLAPNPVPGTVRTVAHLIAVAWAAGVAALLTLGAAAYIGAFGELPRDPEIVLPALVSFDVLNGPAMVAVLGALGVLLVRWVPLAWTGPLAAVAVFMFGTGLFYSDAATRWFWIVVRTSANLEEPAATMGWHLLYMLGLTVVIGALAQLRRARSGGVRVGLALGLALAGVGGVLQFLAASSA